MPTKQLMIVGLLISPLFCAPAIAETAGNTGTSATVFPPVNCAAGGALYWDGQPGHSVACVQIAQTGGGPKYQFSCTGNICYAMNSQTGKVFWRPTGNATGLNGYTGWQELEGQGATTLP